MFGDDSFDLIVGRKAALARRFQAAIDASKLRRRRMIFPLAQFLVNFEREFGQQVLGMFRPSFPRAEVRS